MVCATRSDPLAARAPHLFGTLRLTAKNAELISLSALQNHPASSIRVAEVRTLGRSQGYQVLDLGVPAPLRGTQIEVDSILRLFTLRHLDEEQLVARSGDDHALGLARRSEERRVGKEGRAQWRR